MVIHCDSQVVTNQVNGDYECKGKMMKKYLEQVKKKVDDLQAKIIQIDPIDVQEIGSGSNWTTPLVSYLKNNTLPDDKEAIRKLKVQATQFVLIKDVLYKRSFSRSHLRCLGPEEADYVMREVHEGICRNHSGLWSLVYKLIRAKYYWPTMQKDS